MFSLPLIKVLLLLAIAAVAVVAFRGSSRAAYRVLWRGYGLLVAILAVFSVLFPNALTDVAHTMGVGRGADLVLYLLVVSFMLSTVVLVRRISDLERHYVEMSRALALKQWQRDHGGRSDQNPA